MLFNSRYKSKILILLVISFVMLILVTVFVIYFSTINTMKEQVLEQSYNSLTQLQVSLETVIDAMNRSLVQTALDKDVQTFVDRYDELNLKERSDISKRMMQLRKSSRYFEKMYVYYFRDERVIDLSASVAVAESIYESADKELIETVSERCIGDMYSKPYYFYNISESSDTEPRLVIAMPVSPTAVSPKAVIILTLKLRYFDEMLSYISVEGNARVNVFDDSGNFLFGKGGQLVSFDKSDEPVKADEKNSKKVNGVNYLTASKVSPNTGWVYLYEIKEESVSGRIDSVRVYLLLTTLAALVVALTCSIFLAEKLYKPVGKIVSNLKDSDDINKGDEFRYIDRKINAIISEKKSIEQLLKENHNFLKDNMLQKLLNGQFSDESAVIKKFEYYGISFIENACYVICVIGIDQFGAIANNYTEKEIDSLLLYCREITGNCFLDGQGFTAELIQGRDDELVLFVCESKEQEDAPRLQNKISSVFEEITRQLDITVTIGVGSVVDELLDLNLSHEQALAAFRSRIIAGNNRIIWFEDIKKSKAIQIAYPFKHEKEIFANLKSADNTGIDRATAFYFDYLRDFSPDYEQLKHVFVLLLNDTMRVLMELSIGAGLIFDKQDKLYEEVFALDTLDLAQEYFLNLFHTISGYISQQTDGFDEDISQQILRFVEDNCYKEEISLELLAKTLHFSTSYIAKTFKHTTGQSIREYIIFKRIALSKELLTDKDMKVVDVARKVGYPNVRSFINIFKKYTGETPGSYKAKMLSGYKRQPEPQEE